MRLLSRYLPVLLCGVVLSGCSLFEDDEEEITMAELVPIEQKFEPITLWEKSIGTGVEGFYSRLQPTVGGGYLFAASREGEIKAFDQLSGKEIWSANVNKENEEFWGSIWSSSASARVSGGLTFDEGTLYLGTENGEVFAFSSSNGELLWRAEVRGEVVAKPAVASGFVVVNTSSGILAAYDAKTGEEKWTFEQDVPPLTLRGVSAPITAQGAVLLGQSDGKFTAIILENGRQAWEEKIASPSGSTDLERLVDIDGTPVLKAGVIYTVAYNGNLAAIELRSGRVIWKREYSSFENVALSGQSVTVTDSKSHVYNLERRSGIETWSQLSLFGRKVTAAVEYRDYIVIGDVEGYLHFLDKADGSFSARIEVDSDGLYAAPIVADDIMYVQTRSGKVLAIQTP